jgi:hypothetical protein
VREGHVSVILVHEVTERRQVERDALAPVSFALSLWERVGVRAYGAQFIFLCLLSYAALISSASPNGRGEIIDLDRLPKIYAVKTWNLKILKMILELFSSLDASTTSHSFSVKKVKCES